MTSMRHFWESNSTSAALNLSFLRSCTLWGTRVVGTLWTVCVECLYIYCLYAPGRGNPSHSCSFKRYEGKHTFKTLLTVVRVAAIHQFYHSLPMDVSACYHCMVYEYIGAHVFKRLVIVLLTMDSSFAVGQKCDKWSHFLVRLKKIFFKSQAWSRHQLNYSQVQMNLSFYSETLCRFGLVSSFLISQCVVLMSCYGAVRDAWCILKTLHSSVGPVIALKRCCWWVKCLAPQGGHAKKKKNT